MAVRIRPNAPRFHALLQRRQGRRIFMMTRSAWDALAVAADEPVLLSTDDLRETPVATAPTFLAATERRTSERVELSIFRADLGDDPNPINVDTYEVWEDSRARVNIRAMVSAATTSTGDNLDRYVDGHVFLVSETTREGHHRTELPEHVVVLLRRLGSAV